MDDLASELAMSKGTLYRYFPDKMSLVEAVLHDKVQETERCMDAIAARDVSDFPATLHTFVSCLHQHIEEFRPPFVRDLNRMQAESVAALETQKLALIRKNFGKFLDKGCKADFFRDDINPVMVMEVLLAALQTIVRQEKLDAFGLNAQEAIREIYSIILYGITRRQEG